MGRRGRPPKSKRRRKIASILKEIGFSYGYEIYKIYEKVFSSENIRNIYYNLKKGVEEGKFVVVEVRKEVGSFTWGNESERVYYTLGPYANPFHLNEGQKEILSDIEKRKIEDIGWEEKIENKKEELEKEIEEFNREKKKMNYEMRKKEKEKLEGKKEKLKKWIKEKDISKRYKKEIDTLTP